MGFLSSDKLIVGYDLGNEYSQISYALSEHGEAATLSLVAGAQVYNIPTILCKRFGVNQWLYGREAQRCADAGEGVLVENLLLQALDGETVVVDGDRFDPVALLALFFKRSLNLLSQTGARITAIMITSQMLDRRILDCMSRVVEGIHLKAERIALQSYAESFYSYMLRQPRELWSYPAVLLDYGKGGIRAYRLESNRRTTPIVVSIRETEYGFPEYALPVRGEEGAEGRQLSQGEKAELDAAFLEIARDICGGATGSIFLIGDGFGGDWMKESLRFLCRGRRVFQGNNLFSKGACCGMQERMAPTETGGRYVFLGKDKLKANVGMRILRQGQDSYYALLDAGTNWYEAERTTEVYLQDGNELMLVVTPLIRKDGAPEKGGKLFRIVLEGLAGNIARLKLHFFLKEENCLAVEAEDLGFGEFRVSSGRVWREDIEI